MQAEPVNTRINSLCVTVATTLWLRRSALVLAVCLASQPTLAANSPALTSAEATELFQQKIQPLLESRCLACHGQDEKKIKGGLDLRSRASAGKGGDSGKPSIIPGKPEQSPLFRAVTRTAQDFEPMPPKGNDRLSAVEVEAIRRWIAAGAASS